MELGINDIRNTQNIQNLKSAKRQDDSFADTIQLPNRDMSGGHAPYDYLAKDGEINYNGVIFQLDTKQNQLLLGDTSDKSKCLNIQLSGGGYLVVNKDNLGQLSDVIGMFNAKDQFLILNALMMERKIKETKGEIEEADSIMIGGKAYTQKEWDQTIDRFDEAEENLQEQVDQAEEEAAQKAMSESDIHIAYERMRKPRRDKTA